MHTDFSGGSSGGMVFPSLSEFSKIVVIHTVKGFGIINKAEVDYFSGILLLTVDVGNLTSGSSAFSKSTLNIWEFSAHVLLKSSLENFEHCFASR